MSHRLLIVADQLLDKLLDHNLQFAQQTGAGQIVDDLMTEIRSLHAIKAEADSLRAVNAELLDALTEVFSIGDRLVSDVYGGEFVHKARAAIASASKQGEQG